MNTHVAILIALLAAGAIPGRSQSISSISPTSIPNSTQFTLSISGSGFPTCAQYPTVVAWVVFGNLTFGTPGCNGSSASMSVTIPASATTTPGGTFVQVAVYNGNTGQTTYSNGANLTITQINPVIGSISPTSASAGGPGFNLTINGSHILGNGFFGGAVFNGTTVSMVGGNGYSGTPVIVAIPASLIQIPGIVSVYVATLGGVSNAVNFNIAPCIPSIAAMSPPTIAPLPPSSGPASVTINGANFLSTSLAYANGAPLATTYVSATQLSVLIDPTIPQAPLPGGIAITVENGPSQVSNAVALVIGGGTNAGTIVRAPRAAPPGTPFSFRVEGGIPGAALTLAVDLGTPSVVIGWPTAAADMVLAVGTSMLVPLRDGMGVFGTPDGTVFSPMPTGTAPGGVYVLPGVIAPNPPLGVDIVIQAVYVDPASPTGYRLTWARYPDQI